MLWSGACVCTKKKMEIIEQETVRGKFIQKQHQHKYTRVFCFVSVCAYSGKYKIKERKKENLTYMNIFLGAIYTHKEYVLKKWKSEYKS